MTQRVSTKKITELIAFVSVSGILSLTDSDIRRNSFIWTRLHEANMFGRISVLEISGNEVKYLPQEVWSLVGLTSIYASKCALQKISPLVILSNLRSVKLDYNDLENETTGTFPVSLNSLNLSYNHYEVLPNSILSLVNLVVLDLTGNRVHSIFGVGTLISLQNLLLDDNHISELPLEISGLLKLKEISLRRNDMRKLRNLGDKQSIPEEFFLHTPVEIINIEENPKLSFSEMICFEGASAFVARYEDRERSSAVTSLEPSRIN
mmetsp:Transcript_15154/g.15281  ORF Transcript_15154/g.15281 Transcript_15154/m.15281 type:complete len:264 (+) Transcript_15154:159-950(+)